MKRVCFWRRDVFLTKYGQESSDFFVKNGRKKGYSIDVVLTELTFFLPNMGMTERGFSLKINKK